MPKRYAKRQAEEVQLIETQSDKRKRYNQAKSERRRGNQAISEASSEVAQPIETQSDKRRGIIKR